MRFAPQFHCRIGFDTYISVETFYCYTVKLANFARRMSTPTPPLPTLVSLTAIDRCEVDKGDFNQIDEADPSTPPGWEFVTWSGFSPSSEAMQITPANDAATATAATMSAMRAVANALHAAAAGNVDATKSSPAGIRKEAAAEKDCFFVTRGPCRTPHPLSTIGEKNLQRSLSQNLQQNLHLPSVLPKGGNSNSWAPSTTGEASARP